MAYIMEWRKSFQEQLSATSSIDRFVTNTLQKTLSTPSSYLPKSSIDTCSGGARILNLWCTAANL